VGFSGTGKNINIPSPRHVWHRLIGPAPFQKQIANWIESPAAAIPSPISFAQPASAGLGDEHHVVDVHQGSGR